MSNWNKLPFTVIEANGYRSHFSAYADALAFVCWLLRQNKQARIIWND